MDAMDRTDGVRISGTELTKFAAAVVRAVGMSEEDAATCAEAMVWSDLRGSPQHGVAGRLPQVVDRVRNGGVNPRPDWNVVRETAATAVLDADGGWGQAAGTRGMRLAVEKARACGVGTAIVRNTDVAAALGWYPTVAIRERMIGMVIGNTMPLMAPWGGATKLLGNQPFAVGAPAGRQFPILFDSVVAAMSRNGIERAHERGELLPEGAVVDERGEPIVDPAAALAGRVLPMGGHRGSGLGLMWELLTGVLAGGRMAPEVGGTPMGISLYCHALDPAAMMDYDDFVARVDELADRVHAVTPAPGVERVRVPGERGYAHAATSEQGGIHLSGQELDQLRALGAGLGVALPG